MLKTIGKILVVLLILLIGVAYFGAKYWIPGMMTKTEAEQEKTILQQTDITPKYHSYKVGNRNMRYVEIGDTSQPLVIFLHGSPGSKDNYTDYLMDSTLLQNVLMIAVDRPGFQGSDEGIAEPSLEQQAACIKPIVAQFPHKKIILIGHSLGGPIIARMAMDYGSLINGLVIVAGSLDPELEPKEWYRPYFKAVPWFFADILVSSNLEIMAHKLELTKMLSLWDKIQTSTVIIQGTKDDLVHPNNASFAKAKMVNATVRLEMVENGNHFILWSRMDLVKKAIFELLN